MTETEAKSYLKRYEKKDGNKTIKYSPIETTKEMWGDYYFKCRVTINDVVQSYTVELCVTRDKDVIITPR